MHLSFEDTLEKTGRMLAERFGIQVVCQGLECCTDGNTIYLPGLPADLPEELWLALRGYLDHEAAHLIANSDFAGVQQFINQHGRQAFSILNSLEDIRVETVLCEKYSGSAVNLQHGYTYALKNADPQADLLWQVGTALYAIGRERDYSMLSVHARELAEKFTSEAVAARTAPDTAAVEKLALSVWKVLSTLIPSASSDIAKQSQNQSGDATQQVFVTDSKAGRQGKGGSVGSKSSGNAGQPAESKKVASSPTNEKAGGQKKPDSGSSGTGAESTAHDSDANASASANSKSVQGATAHGSAGNTEPASGNRIAHAGEQNTSAGIGTAQSGADNSDPSQNSPVSLRDALKGSGVMGSLGSALSTGITRSVVKTRAYRPYSTREDKVIEVKRGSPDLARGLQRQARTVCGGISQKLLLCLQARQHNRWLGDQDHGQINPAALHRMVSCAQPRIFRTRVRAEALNTAVTLLIDQSRSMKGERIHLAMLTALAFTESLERLNIPVAVEGFSTQEMTSDLLRRRNEIDQHAPEALPGLRMVPLMHTRFKGFSEPMRQALPRFASESVYELTPLGESLIHAARGLAERKEDRRLLFCLTDGRPVAGVGNEAITFQHAKDSIQRIEQAGVEVVLIGIKEACVQQLHEKYVVVNSLPELPKEVMRTLSKILREGKYEKAKQD